MIKLDALRVFVTVARLGTLRAAAEELGRTQSALSMTLKQLEADLNGTLFETDRKRELTDLGRFVRDVGNRMVLDHDRGIALIREYARGETGRLRIASVPSVAAHLLPDVLRSFMSVYKDVRIELMDSDSAAIQDMVASGKVDIGIAGASEDRQDYHAHKLFSDALYVVCRKTDAVAARETGLRWEDLVNAQLIVNETIRAVEQPQAERLIARSHLSARNTVSLLAMVDSGVGITVLPGLATRSLPEGVIAKPMVGPGTLRTISLLSHGTRTESPAARVFRLHLMDALAEMGAEFHRDTNP